MKFVAFEWIEVVADYISVSDQEKDAVACAVELLQKLDELGALKAPENVKNAKN